MALFFAAKRVTFSVFIYLPVIYLLVALPAPGPLTRRDLPYSRPRRSKRAFFEMP